jgi:hypothetical protein
MRTLTTPLLVLLLCPVTFAQATSSESTAVTPRKPAWEWTLDERIARRIDPVLIRERALASEKNLVERGGFKPEEVIPVRFTVEGWRDPELFMPSELFNSILAGVWVEQEIARDTRKQYRQQILNAGWNESLFWQIVEEASAEYWKTTNERLALQRAASTQPITLAERRALSIKAESLNVPGCRLRLDALWTVRQKLGAEKFDRFLYEAIAPKISISSNLPFGNEEWRLRYIEGGCR